MKIYYPTIDEVLETHQKTIEKSGGGALGVLNKNQIMTALEFVQNDDYYPTFEEKIAYLFYSLRMNHCFEDGNKRIAITLASLMLLRNGWLKSVSVFINDMENISYHVAAGSIGKELLLEIVVAYLNDNYEDNEELKLKILDAMAKTPIPEDSYSITE